jgi:hypothetical protein
LDILFDFLLVILIIMLPNILWDLGQLYSRWRWRCTMRKADKINPRRDRD